LKDVKILVSGSAPPRIAEGVAAQFTPEGWDGSDGGIGPGVRGVAASGGTVDAALMDRLPDLEIVANYGVGYDNIDAAEAGRRGVVVTNTPDVLNEEVADTAMGLLLCAVRRFPQADAFVRAGKWLQGPFPLSATLRGRRMGILGLGRIGKAIAKRAEAFGIAVAYHGRSRQPDVPYPYHPTLVGMAEEVDILMVITPGGAETRHLVNADVLRALGPEGVLINVARGSVVDERALIEALRSRTILTAGLDVFEDEPRVPPELIAMDHVVLLPHLGSASVHTRDAMGQLVVDNLVSWFSGKGPLTPVKETPWTGRAA
jgi:lactate dehydrogenase-like 2-hydroxyacid dehydrogenase